MKKQIFITMTVVALTTSLSVSVSARELRSGNSAPASTVWGKASDAFAAKVAELSGGKLTVKHFHAAQLGDEQTVIRQTARGRIDIAWSSNTATSLLAPEFGLLASPYAFESREQADCVTDNYVLKTFGDQMSKAGVHPLATVEVGQQIIMSKKPIKSPSDLAGVKIRTAPTKTDSLYIEAAGGTAIPLGTVDTMPALKTGNVDAVTWPTIYGIAVGYQKDAPNVTVTNHVHQLGSVVVSNKTWNSLNKEEQGWLTKAADLTLKDLRQPVRDVEAEMLKKIAESGNGVNVYYPNEEEMKAWRAAALEAQPVILDELGDSAKQAWAKIETAKKACQ